MDPRLLKLILIPSLSLALVLAVSGAFVWYELEGPGSIDSEQSGASEAVAQGDRTPLLLLQSEPPSELPFVGDEGVDEYGYPRRRVDHIGMQALLRAGEYRALDAHFATLVDGWREDFRTERWLSDAAESFATADPRLDARLDVWVETAPRSAFARWARAQHVIAIGWNHRGDSVASEVGGENMAAFQQAYADALEDIGVALELEPGLPQLWGDAFNTASILGDVATMAEAHARALAACAHCLIPYESRMRSLEPRWGGSISAMEAEVANARRLEEANPALASLVAYPLAERCRGVASQDTPEKALPLCDEATETSGHLVAAYRRGVVLGTLERHEDAVHALDDALATDPQYKHALEQRCRSLVELERYTEALDDYLTLAHLDPSRPFVRGWVEFMAGQSRLIGWALMEEGDRRGAIHHYEIGAMLLPRNRTAQREYTAMVMDPRFDGSPESTPLDELSRRATSAPDDFSAQRDLDYALAAEGRYAEVLPVWERYLERRPHDGRAYFERSGAYHHLGDRTRSTSDRERACEYGWAPACPRR